MSTAAVAQLAHRGSRSSAVSLSPWFCFIFHYWWSVVADGLFPVPLIRIWHVLAVRVAATLIFELAYALILMKKIEHAR